MDYSKPTLLVISGPNGAGKSSYIHSMLPDGFEGAIPFDRDKTRTDFEKELYKENRRLEDILKLAAQKMENYLIEKMDEAIKCNAHFVLETPLSHPDYWRYIDKFQNKGYQIQLNYLCLDKISNCIQRVAIRVKEGGHNVDIRTIKGVYEMNLKYVNEYINTFKHIELYDGSIEPMLLVIVEDNKILTASDGAMKKAWIKNGLTEIFKMIKIFLEEKQLVAKATQRRLKSI